MGSGVRPGRAQPGEPSPVEPDFSQEDLIMIRHTQTLDTFKAQHCTQLAIPLPELPASGKKLLIIGSGGHAAVIFDIVQTYQDVEVIGCADSNPEKLDSEVVHGCHVVVQQKDVLRQCPPETTALLIAIGDDRTRARVAVDFANMGYAFASAVHPSANIGINSHVGAGVTVMPSAVIGPRCVIGDQAIINTASLVDHDCRIGRTSHVAPGARLGGGAWVGEQTLVGIGSSVNKQIKIGDRAVIAVGCVIISDVEDDQKITPEKLGRNCW